MSVPRVLYLTQHGLASPLGRAQCLPYLLRLARGHLAQLSVVSFESDPLPSPELFRLVADAGIEWRALRYHRSFYGLGTALDVLSGFLASLWLVRRTGFDAVHARSYVMATIGLLLSLTARRPFVFDMLGMLADEYADAGHWGINSLRYRATKFVERVLLRRAASVIVLTQRNADYLRETNSLPHVTPVVVIPCCVDLERFSCAAPTAGFPRGDAPRLVYAGSLGTWYQLDQMVQFFVAAREVSPRLQLRVLTRYDRALVDDALRRQGVAADSVEVIAAAPDEVAALLCESDAGLCFIAPMFSKHAASPNKFAEYLACGLPVVGTPGVGDVEDAITAEGVGVVVRDHSPRGHRAAWIELLGQLTSDAAQLRARCRDVARREYRAELAVDRYHAIYGKIVTSR